MSAQRIDTAIIGTLALICVALMLPLVFTSDSTERMYPHACWLEEKTDGSAERICGSVNKAPAGAHGFADTAPEEDTPGFDCRADGNKICGSPKGLGSRADARFINTEGKDV